MNPSTSRLWSRFPLRTDGLQTKETKGIVCVKQKHEHQWNQTKTSVSSTALESVSASSLSFQVERFFIDKHIETEEIWWWDDTRARWEHKDRAGIISLLPSMTCIWSIFDHCREEDFYPGQRSDNENERVCESPWSTSVSWSISFSPRAWLINVKKSVREPSWFFTITHSTENYAVLSFGKKGKVLRVLPSGRWLPRNQGWLNFWESKLVTVRKSLHRSCWTELTCQGILLP